MPEPGQPIDQPGVYRLLVLAFAIWAAHFIVAYGAALVFPEQAAARWIAIGALAVALAALVVAVRRYRAQAGAIGLAAGGLAIAAVVLGTAPAIVG